MANVQRTKSKHKENNPLADDTAFRDWRAEQGEPPERVKIRQAFGGFLAGRRAQQGG